MQNNRENQSTFFGSFLVDFRRYLPNAKSQKRYKYDPYISPPATRFERSLWHCSPESKKYHADIQTPCYEKS